MNRGRRRVAERLTDLGAQPSGEPTPAFTAGLERKLAGGAVLAGATVLALPSRQRGGFPTATTGVAVLAAVVLGGTLLGVVGRGGAGALRLAAAVDTTIIMPGGHAAPARNGQTLPNGSVVWTGPNGRASAGTVEIGPGLQAVVDAGRLRLSPLAGDPGAATATPATAAATPPAAVPALHLPISPPLSARLPAVISHPPLTPTTRTPPTTQPKAHVGTVTTTTERPGDHHER